MEATQFRAIRYQSMYLFWYLHLGLRFVGDFFIMDCSFALVGRAARASCTVDSVTWFYQESICDSEPNNLRDNEKP
jgi:hypothetical protein